MYIYLLFTALISSLVLNGYYLYRKHPKKQTDDDAKALLHYLLNGGAIVKIEVLDPTQLLMYRSK